MIPKNSEITKKMIPKNPGIAQKDTQKSWSNLKKVPKIIAQSRITTYPSYPPPPACCKNGDFKLWDTCIDPDSLI